MMIISNKDNDSDGDDDDDDSDDDHRHPDAFFLVSLSILLSLRIITIDGNNPTSIDANGFL